MIKTYFTIAYRNFIRNKIFSLINVLGLSIGISSALVIFLIVNYDFSFDKFEKNGARIYRVVTNMSFSGNPLYLTGVYAPLPDQVKKDVSGIEKTIGFHQFGGNGKVTVPRKNTEKPLQINHQTDIIFADASYFKLIPYQWLAGSEEISLDEPFKVVLTESRARTYFPSMPFESILGKQIVYDDSIITVITGIVKDPVQNTDFIFKEFISQSTIPNSGLKEVYKWTDWNTVDGGSQLFLILGEKTSVKHVESQLNTIIKKYDGGVNTKNNTTEYKLQPLSDLHFSSNYNNYAEHTAHKPTLYGLLAIAAFLLVLGCINFINLTTALASQRAKEIGVRKTLGGSTKQLIMQFMTETLLITIISMLVSIVITPLLLKVFKDFIPNGLHFDLLTNPSLLLFLFSLTLVVTVLAGFYPALVLSRYKPVLVLKNQSLTGTSNSRKAWLRKGLTVSQFLIAQVFCMATFITVKQINFLLTKDLGFKKDAIISVNTPFIWGQKVNANDKKFILLDEVKKIPGIQMVSLGNHPPSSEGFSSSAFRYKDGKKEIETDVRQKYGDTNYLKLYQIKLLAGRNIKVSDTANELIVNETYMHILGFQKAGDVLNKQINGLPVVGVMADFNQESLHASVKPLSFSANNTMSSILHIALQPPINNDSWKTTISAIGKAFKELYPEEDFSYEFVDESVAKFYKSEQDISHVLVWASTLAIFISCMGLLGLVMYTTNSRTKEIGIRKVLGASIKQIVSILSKDFIRLVLIASLIAMPLSWLAMHTWLENFAYKTPIAWWIFVLSTLGMMGIALITLSIQTIRAASANPVESLRAE